MSIHAGRSVVVIWAALAAAGLLLAFAARGAGPLPGDLASTRLLQELLPPNGAAGSLLLYVGGAIWFLPVAALLLALLERRWSDALFVFLVSSTSVLVGDALKLLVARPRPPAELVRVSDLQESYGFPSGTALFSVALLGTVGYLILRARPSRPVVFVTLGVSLPLILANGLSRVYVGEHWATDVLGGWLFGVAWLIALVATHRWWLYRRVKSREHRQI